VGSGLELACSFPFGSAASDTGEGEVGILDEGLAALNRPSSR